MMFDKIALLCSVEIDYVSLCSLYIYAKLHLLKHKCTKIQKFGHGFGLH